MTYRTISRRSVTLTLQPGESLAGAEAAAIIRQALFLCGYTPWEGVRMELFPGRNGSLLIASPLESGPDSSVGGEEEYFTE